MEAADGVLSGLWPWALEGAGGGHPTPLSNLVRLLAAACRRGTPALYHMLKVARCVVRCWSVSSGGEAGCRVWQPCSLQFTGGVRPGSLRRCAARQFTGGVRPGCLGAACGQAVYRRHAARLSWGGLWMRGGLSLRGGQNARRTGGLLWSIHGLYPQSQEAAPLFQEFVDTVDRVSRDCDKRPPLCL